MLAGSRLVAFRDPLGIRPLVLGTVDGGYAVASESVAIDLMGGQLVRDVLPGGGHRHRTRADDPQLPDGRHRRAGALHVRVGLLLPSGLDRRGSNGLRRAASDRPAARAKEAPAESDLVIPVPDSSRPQALGYSEASGIPYAEGLIKNRFVERTFILPDQKKREDEVRVKLHPVPGLLEGKRIVLLDDSIVRGTTLREIVQMVRAAGAKRVDVRIGCPPIVAPCYFGVDMKERKELVANGRTEDEVAKVVGADSVHYLSMAGLVESLGLPQESLCLGLPDRALPGRSAGGAPAVPEAP